MIDSHPRGAVGARKTSGEWLSNPAGTSGQGEMDHDGECAPALSRIGNGGYGGGSSGDDPAQGMAPDAAESPARASRGPRSTGVNSSSGPRPAASPAVRLQQLARPPAGDLPRLVVVEHSHPMSRRPAIRSHARTCRRRGSAPQRPPLAGRRPALYLGVAAGGAVLVGVLTGAGTDAPAQSADLEPVSIAKSRCSTSPTSTLKSTTARRSRNCARQSPRTRVRTCASLASRCSGSARAERKGARRWRALSRAHLRSRSSAVSC